MFFNSDYLRDCLKEPVAMCKGVLVLYNNKQKVMLHCPFRHKCERYSVRPDALEKEWVKLIYADLTEECRHKLLKEEFNKCSTVKQVWAT